MRLLCRYSTIEPTMDKETFTEIRKARNETKAEFAVTIGKQLRMVQYYETGEKVIPPTVVKLLERLRFENELKEKLSN